MVEPMTVTRLVASPAELDDHVLAGDLVAMRIAPDELLMLGDIAEYSEINYPHAIQFVDTGWAGAWLDAAAADEFLLAECEWELPVARPAFAQGMVSHLAAKLWFEEDRTLILVPAPFAAELAERLGH